MNAAKGDNKMIGTRNRAAFKAVPKIVLVTGIKQVDYFHYVDSMEDLQVFKKRQLMNSI